MTKQLDKVPFLLLHFRVVAEAVLLLCPDVPTLSIQANISHFPRTLFHSSVRLRGQLPIVFANDGLLQTLASLAVGHFQQLTRSERFWNAPASECTRARSNILRPSGVRA